jgi:D-alanine-D-alanine ligase
MPHLRIAVVYGGNKAAPDAVIRPSLTARSWKSYEAVACDIAAALRRIGFVHVSVLPENMGLGEELRRLRIDLAWLNTGGVQGYNPVSHAPAMLEMLGIPYVGHDPLTASTLDNKHVFKQCALALGLPTASFMTWNGEYGAFDPMLEPRFRHAFADHRGPFIVKPVSGRASLHVHVVDAVADLPAAVDAVFIATRNLVLIERYLPGCEYAVAVAGPMRAVNGKLERLSDPFAFSAIERALDEDERIFTSMDTKPITADRFSPAPSSVRSQLETLAQSVFRQMHLRTLVRLDVRADAGGTLYLLEANPKPDLKFPGADSTSLVCAGLSGLGMDYDDLILSLIGCRIDELFTHQSGALRHLDPLLVA